MFLDRPPEGIEKIKTHKKITLRISERLWKLVQEKAKKDYSGARNQSKLVNEALNHFFRTASVEDINWSNPTNDYVLINLLTQIKLGSKMKNIGPNPVQINLEIPIYKKLEDLELNIRVSKKLSDVHIKPSIIRIALSQWMYVDRTLVT